MLARKRFRIDILNFPVEGKVGSKRIYFKMSKIAFNNFHINYIIIIIKKQYALY